MGYWGGGISAPEPQTNVDDDDDDSTLGDVLETHLADDMVSLVRENHNSYTRRARANLRSPVTFQTTERQTVLFRVRTLCGVCMCDDSDDRRDDRRDIVSDAHAAPYPRISVSRASSPQEWWFFFQLAYARIVYGARASRASAPYPRG